MHVVQNHITHAQLTAQQGQDLDTKPQRAHLSQRLIRMGDGRHAHIFELNTQPREQRPTDIATQGQLNIGLLTCGLLNLFLVIIRIEHPGEEKQHADSQHRNAEHHQP